MVLRLAGSLWQQVAASGVVRLPATAVPSVRDAKENEVRHNPITLHSRGSIWRRSGSLWRSLNLQAAIRATNITLDFILHQVRPYLTWHPDWCHIPYGLILKANLCNIHCHSNAYNANPYNVATPNPIIWLPVIQTFPLQPIIGQMCALWPLLLNI